MLTDLGVGTTVPDFTLKDTERNERQLSEFRGKNIVLIFFPGAFTGVCHKESCTLRDMEQISNLGGQVIAISVDSPFANKAFADQNNITFPVLSDYNRDVIRIYGIELNDFAGMTGYTAAKRSVFITDKDYIIRYRWVSDDPGVEPPYNELEEALSKLQ